jgi:hypothetical protein
MLFLDELSCADELFGMESTVSLVRRRICPSSSTSCVLPRSQAPDDILGPETAPYVARIIVNDPDNPFEQAFWKGVSIRFELASRLRRHSKVIAMPHVDYATLWYLHASENVVLALLVESPFSDCKSTSRSLRPGPFGPCLRVGCLRLSRCDRARQDELRLRE